MFKAYYGSAKKDCTFVHGGRLANIETKDDFHEIFSIGKNSSADRYWVGAEILHSVECAESATFRSDCWIWEGSKKPINSSVIGWNISLNNKSQASSDRAYFETQTGQLNYERSSTANRYLCEIK